MSRTHAFSLALLSALTMGCATESTRRPIEELYEEALQEARIRMDPAEGAARAASAPAPEGPAKARALPPLERPAGPRVSDSFVETNVREALQSLALQAGVQLLVDDLVQGSVTAVVDDQPLETALRNLLLPLGVHVAYQDDLYVVCPPDPHAALYRYVAESAEFSPNHVDADTLKTLLGVEAVPFVRVDEPRQRLLLRAPRAILRELLTDLRRLDRAVPQVVLEAIICAYEPSERLEFGLDVGGGAKTSGDGAVNGALQGLTFSGLRGPAALEGLKNFDFASIYLRALESEGYVSVRAAPRVMAQHGKRAVIAIGAETYFTVGDGRNLIQQLKPIQTGIILNIVPWIRGDRVTVEIERAEVSDEVRPAQLVSNDIDASLPTVNTRRVSTTVHVRDGETIVIGGLVQRRVVDRTVKVPFLGDIPILGLLFQRIDRREEEVEIAIFLSPRIVRS